MLAADDLSARRAAERFAVSVSYVIKARQRRQRTGMVTTKVRGYRRPRRVAGLERAILRQVGRRSSATLAELRAWLLRRHGVGVSIGTMWKILHELGLTFKKSRSGPVSRRVWTLPQPVVSGAEDSAD